MPDDRPPLSALEAREQLNQALQKAWLRCSAESSPLALLLVSFDGAETAQGAGVLQRALEVHCARTHDVALRRSSAEFAAILPDTPPAGARLIGERLVEAMRLEDAHRVSVGLAVSVPDDHHEAADLLRRAETALQSARDNGGDRVVGGMAAQSTPPSSPKSALAHLLELLPGGKSNPDLKRRTD